MANAAGATATTTIRTITRQSVEANRFRIMVNTGTSFDDRSRVDQGLWDQTEDELRGDKVWQFPVRRVKWVRSVKTCPQILR
jgi:hypothetical protein